MPKQGRSKALEDSEEDIDYSTWPEGLQQLREELGSTVHYAKKADMKTMYDAIKPDIPKSLQSFLECLREASQEEGKAKIPVSDPDNVIYEKLVGRVVRKRKYDSWFKIAAEAMSSPGCRPEHTWVAQALEAHASISAREAINDRTFYEKVSERSVEILNAKREDLKARLLEEGVQSTWDKLVELRELRAELGVESLAGHPVVPRRPPVEETSWKEEWGECPEDIQKVINICSDKTKRKNFHLSAEQVREIRSRGQYTKDQQLLDIFEYATSGNSSKPIAGLAELSNLNDSTPKDILLNSLSRIVEIYRKLEDSRKQQQASASHLEAVLTSILKHRVMFILRDAKAKAQKESKTYFEDAIRAKRDALLKNTSQVKKSTVEILEALERIEEALGCLRGEEMRHEIGQERQEYSKMLEAYSAEAKELEGRVSHRSTKGLAEKRKKAIENQIAYVNALMAEFRKRFPERAWRYPEGANLLTFEQVKEINPASTSWMV